MTVLITGAGGFIGSHLLAHLKSLGEDVVGFGRRRNAPSGWRSGDLNDPASLLEACRGISTVVHCAGYAHAFQVSGEDISNRHWRVNFIGTRNLIEAAGRAGGRRFVFLSSVKAMGEPGSQCVDEHWQGKVFTAYGQAKRAAEVAVQELGARFGMTTVILRPAMVYGAGGKGNLERMALAISRGYFPPLPETGNRRSLVHVDDMVSAIVLAMTAPVSGSRAFIVAHPEAPSGRELYDALRQVLGMRPCRWHVPGTLLRTAGVAGSLLEALLCRRLPINAEAISRLLDSARYSPGRLQSELGWMPNVPLVCGLQRMLLERQDNART